MLRVGNYKIRDVQSSSSKSSCFINKDRSNFIILIIKYFIIIQLIKTKE